MSKGNECLSKEEANTDTLNNNDGKVDVATKTLEELMYLPLNVPDYH